MLAERSPPDGLTTSEKYKEYEQDNLAIDDDDSKQIKQEKRLYFSILKKKSRKEENNDKKPLARYVRYPFVEQLFNSRRLPILAFGTGAQHGSLSCFR